MKKTTTKRTRKGVDELNLNVVAQKKVTTTNKSKATFRLPTVHLIILIIVLAFFACDDKPKDDPKPQFKTITFGANLSTNVTGHMTNAQWDNVIGKLTTALNAAANDGGNLGTYCAGMFGAAGVSIDLVKTQEYSYYKTDLTALKIFLNSDYVIGATQADLSAKIAAAINGGYGVGHVQQ